MQTIHKLANIDAFIITTQRVDDDVQVPWFQVDAFEKASDQRIS